MMLQAPSILICRRGDDDDGSTVIQRQPCMDAPDAPVGVPAVCRRGAYALAITESGENHILLCPRLLVYPPVGLLR